MGILDALDLPDLPTEGRAVPKPSSRLQDTKAEKKLALVDERAFKTEVWLRDRFCRCCGRHVNRAISRVPERGEIHHLHGRTGDLRFEARAAVLVCCECHEKLTGRVAEKWAPTIFKTWLLNGEKVIDARQPITFKRIA